MLHPYLLFRVHLARHALRDFAASMGGAGLWLLLAFGQLILGALAFIALPPMWLASQGDWLALAGQAALMALPMWFLRKRVLPLDVLRWQRALPLPARIALQADGAVAGLLMLPLALAYALSGCAWVVQKPDWLRPQQAVAGCLASFLLTWVLASLILRWRALARRDAGQGSAAPAVQGFAPAPVKWRMAYFWHRLFWLPFWRVENVVGWQQCALLALALSCALAWQISQWAVLAIFTSGALLVLTDRGDKAVLEQIGVLRPLAAGWPFDFERLAWLARCFALAPGLLVLLVLGRAVTRPAGIVYLVLAVLAQWLIMRMRRPDIRANTLLCCLVLLSAVGSELWH